MPILAYQSDNPSSITHSNPTIPIISLVLSIPVLVPFPSTSPILILSPLPASPLRLLVTCTLPMPLPLTASVMNMMMRANRTSLMAVRMLARLSTAAVERKVTQQLLRRPAMARSISGVVDVNCTQPSIVSLNASHVGKRVENAHTIIPPLLHIPTVHF